MFESIMGIALHCDWYNPWGARIHSLVCWLYVGRAHVQVQSINASRGAIGLFCRTKREMEKGGLVYL